VSSMAAAAAIASEQAGLTATAERAGLPSGLAKTSLGDARPGPQAARATTNSANGTDARSVRLDTTGPPALGVVASD
jgi:hypothetical protein